MGDCCYDSFTAGVTGGQYKWRVIVVPQQGSLIEYTQTEVKGRDKSASVDRGARGGRKQPHIRTQHKHRSGTLTLTG